ncbi:3-hydroxyacyl-CoA dehydrogenase type-2, partial [Aureobasidium melanogenum]
MHIKDRLFVISGGSSGLGLATARNLHERGGYIAILDLNVESGGEAVKELGSERSRFFEADVSDTESITKAVEGVSKWIQESGKPIGAIISAAGVGRPGKIIDRKGEPLSLSSIDFVLNINLRGTLDFVRQLLPLMIKNKPTEPDNERGCVILVSSSAAYDGQPGQVSYAASKGAVRSMTLPMARDLAPFGIRVVTIAPSLFESNMTAVMSDKVRKSLERVMEFPKRAGKGEEFAELTRHAIENIMLNGVAMRLDGAMRMPTMATDTSGNYFHTRLDSKAPINDNTKIISRSSPSSGVVTYTLQIGTVSVPNVSLAEVTDYVSAHDLEVFENQSFKHDIDEEEIRIKNRLAAKAQARRQNRAANSDSSSETSSTRARSVSSAPLSGSENVKAGGRQRPSYTHFYPKQRAPRGSLKPTIPTAESQVNNGEHRDNKRRRLREDRDGSVSSARDAESVYSVASPKLAIQPPSAMEQAAGMVSDAQEESDPMELDDDESDDDIDMPIRQPIRGASNTTEQAVKDQDKGAASAFFTFRDHAVPPVPRNVSANLSAKAKLVASLTEQQVPVASARDSTKASTLPTSTPNSLKGNDLTQAVASVSHADSGSDSEGSEEYVVEKILAHGLSDPKSHDKSVHGTKPVMLYHVKWEGYDATTWEPATSFQDTDVLQEYWYQHAQKQKQKQKQKPSA